MPSRPAFVRLRIMRSLFFFALFASPAFAQDQVSPAISFLKTGVICAPETVATAPAPDTIAGVTNVIEQDPPFVSTINRVPAVLGIGFGAKAQSSDILGISDVTIFVRHPAMGNEAVTLQSYETRISGLDPSITFYQFDFDYELLPGVWTIEARKGATLLYRSRFEVIPPQDIPELADVCGFIDLLS